MNMPLTVFTNGIVVAQELAHVPDIQVYLLGGRIRPENMSIIGPFADEMLGKVWFDQLFLGASAIDDNGWVSSYDADEAQLNTRMLSRSDNVFLLADQQKFGVRATYNVFRLTGDETLILDGTVPTGFSGYAAEKQLNIVTAQSGAGHD